MASSSSPCAACKLQRRKCTPECVFAPHFPPDYPQKFANVHRVFGASNVQKLLTELPHSNREDAVTSLVFEADARLRDPVYGCVSYISYLQDSLKATENELRAAKKELASYIGPAALYPMVPAAAGGYMPSQPLGHSSNGVAYNMPPMIGMQGPLVIRDPQEQAQQKFLQQQQQMYEAQHFALAMEQQQQQQKDVMQRQNAQEEPVRFDGGFNGSSTVTGSGMSQITSGDAAVSPSSLMNFHNLNMNSPEMEKLQQQQPPQYQLQAQLMHPQEFQQPQEQQSRARSEEEYCNAGPSS